MPMHIIIRHAAPVLISAIALVGCSGSGAGGDAAGFCRRWGKMLTQVESGELNSTGELLDAIQPSTLGDPGGDLSEYRALFEDAIRIGTNEDALLYTDLITSLCAEVSP
jgi:hypothetical protein